MVTLAWKELEFSRILALTVEMRVSPPPHGTGTQAFARFAAVARSSTTDSGGLRVAASELATSLQRWKWWAQVPDRPVTCDARIRWKANSESSSKHTQVSRVAVRLNKVTILQNDLAYWGDSWAFCPFGKVCSKPDESMPAQQLWRQSAKDYIADLRWWSIIRLIRLWALGNHQPLIWVNKGSTHVKDQHMSS